MKEKHKFHHEQKVKCIKECPDVTIGKIYKVMHLITGGFIMLEEGDDGYSQLVNCDNFEAVECRT